jgi:hypothetical protein
MARALLDPQRHMIGGFDAAEGLGKVDRFERV